MNYAVHLVKFAQAPALVASPLFALVDGGVALTGVDVPKSPFDDISELISSIVSISVAKNSSVRNWSAGCFGLV